jgi:glycosyltransferase involved in cell wall biosynthesis
MADPHEARRGGDLMISLLLPVYNEKPNLPRLLQEIETALAGQPYTYEVIAVDDGSNDGSTELLEKLAAEKPYLKVLMFRRNHGQTAAFDAGFRHASGDIVVTLDSDLQNDPADIPRMIAKIDEGFDFVSGWRKNRQDGFVLRLLPSKIANWLIRKITGTKVHDLGCSLKVYRREIVQELHLYGEMHRFIAVLAEGVGARIAEYEVHHRPRVAGVSKYNLTRTFKVLLDLTTVWFLQGFQTKPIYVFGTIGGILIALSGLLSTYVLYEKFWLDIFVHRNPLFTIAIFFALVGVQFLAIGLLAELLIRIYFQSQDFRPYTIARKIGFERQNETVGSGRP